MNDTTGCSDLAMDPHDPDTLFAGMWQVQVHQWNLASGGTGGGVFVSHDGGDDLDEAQRPRAARGGDEGRQDGGGDRADQPAAGVRARPGGDALALPVGRRRPHVDAGEPVARARRAGPYYTRFAVSPDNENLLYFMSVAYSILA